MTCPADPGARAVLGCDGPGTDRTMIPSLDGMTTVALDRCPNHYVTPMVREVIRAWAMVEKHGIWPVAGGLDDQAAVFVDAVSFLDGEAARYREEDRKKR